MKISGNHGLATGKAGHSHCGLKRDIFGYPRKRVESPSETLGPGEKEESTSSCSTAALMGSKSFLTSGMIIKGQAPIRPNR